VTTLADAGVDFVKIYVWLRPDLAGVAAEAAHARGLKVAGHVGHVMTVAEGLEAGLDAFEHVRVGRELIPKDHLAEFLSLPPRKHDAIASFAAWRFIDPNGGPARDLISRMVDRNVALTPTLSFSASILRGRSLDRETEPGSWEADPRVQAAWEASAYTTDYTASDWASAPLEMARQLEFVGLAHQAGVRITAGTDTPNPFIAPGSSIHGELGLLREAGLSPLDIITAATSRAAELLGRETELGTVRAGALADLLVVDGDPSVDLGSLRRVRMVLKDGIQIHASPGPEPPSPRWHTPTTTP
jgi:hypothetical protein